MSKLYFNGVNSPFNAVASLITSNQTDIRPSISTKGKSATRQNKISFGNGYEQRSPDGLNPTVKTWSVNFSSKSRTVGTELIKFFEGISYSRTPDEYIYWTPPVPPYNTLPPDKYVVGDFDYVWRSYDIVDITATFTQTFEL